MRLFKISTNLSSVKLGSWTTRSIKLDPVTFKGGCGWNIQIFSLWFEIHSFRVIWNIQFPCDYIYSFHVIWNMSPQRADYWDLNTSSPDPSHLQQMLTLAICLNLNTSHSDPSRMQHMLTLAMSKSNKQCQHVFSTSLVKAAVTTCPIKNTWNNVQREQKHWISMVNRQLKIVLGESESKDIKCWNVSRQQLCS